MAPTPTKRKKSALLSYALRNVKQSPSTRPLRHGPGGINVRPTGGGQHLQAPGTALGTYANRLVGPRNRLPSIQYPGQADATMVLGGPPRAGTGGGGGGSWFQNLGKDALSIVTGVPGTLALAGRTAVSPFTTAYGYGGGLVGAPGARSARGFSAGVGRDLITAGKATVDDFKVRWGPAFEAGGLIDIALDRDNARSDLRRFGSQIKEHPGFFALDVGAAASLGAGASVRAASSLSKAGRSMTRARHARQAAGESPFPVNAPPPGWRSSVLRATAPPPRGGVMRRDPLGRALAQETRKGRVDLLNPNNRTLVQEPVARGPQPAGRSAGQLSPGWLERQLTDPGLARLADSRKLANRRRTRKLTTGTVSVTDKDGVTRVLELPTREVSLRPYAPSPLMRPMQRAFDEKVMGGLERLANKRGPGRYGKERFFSSARRDERAVRYSQKQSGIRWENRRDQSAHELTREFSRKVLYNRGITKDKRAEALVALRVDNVAVDKPGRSALEGVRQYIATQERRLAEDEKRGVAPEALAAHRANVDLVKSIPDEMISAPPRAVVEGAEEARKMLAAAQDIRGRTDGIYGVTDETRKRADLYREAVSTGQAEYFDDVGRIMNPERREALVGQGVHLPPAPDVVRALREIYTGGLQLGRRPSSSEALATAQRLIDNKMLPQPIAGQFLLQGSRLDDFARKALTQLREGRLPLTKAGEVDTRALAEQLRTDRVLRERLDAPENLFRPGERPADGGVFRGSQAVGYAAGHKGGSRSSFGLGELGRADKQSTGWMIGRDSLSRESLMKTVQRSINAFYTQESVTETVNRFALRQAGSNKPYAIRSAAAAHQLDSDAWTLVSVNELRNLVKELHDIDPGAGKPDSYSRFANRDEILRNLHQGDESVVALPRALVDEIKQTIDDPHGLWKRYDKVMDIWRAGILAYTPRWFINNLVGTSIFLGVLSGLDIRAFMQASRNKRFFQEHVVPFESESVSHAYAIGASDAGRGGLEPTGSGFERSRFMRGAHQMFLLNQRLEGRLRRAAYITRAKQNLRTEGRLPRHNLLRKLSDDELYEALVRMPDDLKQQTLRDMEFFVGRYKSYGKLEKRVFRRIIPFYAWLRVINTWAFGLPFKSPLRAEAVRIATSMGHTLSEDTEGLPLWEKGRLTFGDFALRTNNINPLYSVAEEIAGTTGAHNPSAGLTDLIRVAGGSMSPPLQIAIGQIAGRNPFGTRDFSVPTGYGDTAASFGAGRMRRNPVTGEIENVKPSPALWEQAMDQLIPFAGPAKTALAGQRQPYDTSSLLDLVGEKVGLVDEESVYQPPPKTPSGRGRLPAGLTPALGLLGAPIYSVDQAQEQLAKALADLRLAEAERSSARLLLRERMRRVQDTRSR